LIAGDVFDRGEKVTECLWLIYRLEQEAVKSGGRVHYLMGNHELMVLRGDLRYVAEKYTEGIVQKGRISYDRLFGEQTEPGRWLRTKNAIVIINGILFVHGGISPELIRHHKNITDINRTVRENLVLAPYKKLLGQEEMFVYNEFGPLWYRGFFVDRDSPQLTELQIEDILQFFGAEAVVVGHSETDSVMSHYGGLVYSIDVPAEELHSLQALLWEDGKFYRVKGDGEKKLLD
ncbi:MAG: metallophosphoesterase, partial [Candidatus Zixiibacteriota bacterium]